MPTSGLRTKAPATARDDGGFLLRVPEHVDAVVESLREALAAEGFCVAAVVDLQVIARVRAHACLEPYVVLEVLDGRRATALLDLDRGMGRLLPWHVVVRGDRAGHGSVVQAPDPLRLARHVDRREPDTRVLALAGETRDRLLRSLVLVKERVSAQEGRT